jgi:hypothetical protein
VKLLLTILVGIEDGEVDEAIALMRAAYARDDPTPPKVPTGPVFVLGVEQLERI